jgi:site-specific DNA-cytosine methylase
MTLTVLSLFDGMSCGRLALERAGIEVDKYYASEIDKYAIAVSKKNFPDIEQLGDVTQWRTWSLDWSKIDLLIGGSPCQNLSFAGNGKGLEGEKTKCSIIEKNLYLKII